MLTLQTVPSTVAPSTPNTTQRCANEQGFSLPTDLRCAMNQHKKLEQRYRYIIRPAIANERLKLNSTGDVVLRLKHPNQEGTTLIVMSSLELIQRLVNHGLFSQ